MMFVLELLSIIGKYYVLLGDDEFFFLILDVWLGKLIGKQKDFLWKCVQCGVDSFFRELSYVIVNVEDNVD